MAARTPTEAAREYIDMLQQALSCVAIGVPVLTDGFRTDGLNGAFLPGDSPVRMRGPSQLLLHLKQRFALQRNPDSGLWSATTRGYFFAIHDVDGREILSYHWNPAGTPSFPHLHLNAGARVGLDAVRKAHIPTGWITVHDVVLLAVRELGAAPVRADWHAIVAGGTDAFRGEAPPV